MEDNHNFLREKKVGSLCARAVLLARGPKFCLKIGVLSSLQMEFQWSEVVQN